MRVRGLRVHRLDHLPVIGADKQHVVCLAAGGLHLRIHCDLSEPVTEATQTRSVFPFRNCKLPTVIEIRRLESVPLETRTKELEGLLETGADDDRLAEKTRHQLVHEGMRVDEVESKVGQRAGVVDALPGPGVRDLGALHGQPVRVDSALLLEVALERVGDVLQGEGADG